MALVTTIIVTFNGSRWIRRCLDALLKSERPVSIVVVDNASTDDTVQILQSYGDALHLILSKTNLGFGGGNNLGIRYALEKGSDYFFLLNQDAYVTPDCIGKLVDCLQMHPAIGILSPLQLAPNGNAPDHAFEKYMRKAKPLYPKVLSVRFVNAAAWMIPAKALQKAGLFHPVFAHYGEDNHYASRMQYHGLKICIDTQASVIHDREQSFSNERAHLLRQLRTVPLYTLLDLRKPFWIAKLLAKRKLNRIEQKLKPFSKEEQVLFHQQAAWLSTRLQEAQAIRKATKNTEYLINHREMD